MPRRNWAPKKRKTLNKAGDKNYLTPTQLRNAKKHREKKEPQHPAKRGSNALQRKDPSLQYIDNPVKAPVARQAIQFFSRNVGKALPTVLGPTTGWRTLAKLAARAVDGQLTLGLLHPGSHSLVPTDDSPALHASIHAAANGIQLIARQFEIVPFDELAGTGDLRNVVLAVERSTAAVQVTLVWNDPCSLDEIGRKKSQEAIVRLSQALKEQESPNSSWKLHSLWVHYNENWKDANTVLSQTGQWEHIEGPEWIEENPLDDKISLYFPPTVFRQANLDGFAKIVQVIVDHVKELDHPRCLELYGGVGAVGLHVAQYCRDLTSSDENPNNVACFERSVKKMGLTNATYKDLSATAMVESGRLNTVDLVILNPPHKGLEQTVCQALCDDETPLRQLVYVSCGFDSFQRDCRSLMMNGGWNLDRAEGHLLLPGSNSIETLAFFSREVD